MNSVIFIGFDVNATGGISTYSRHQITALQTHYDISVINFLVKSESDEQIKCFSINHRGVFKLFSSFVAFSIILFLLVKKRPKLIMVNHVNLAPLAFVIRLLFKVKYTLNMYNVEVLRELSFYRKYSLINADMLFGDCAFIIERFRSKYKTKAPIKLLYDPVEIDKYQGHEKIGAQERLGEKFNIDLKDKFVICTVAMFQASLNKGHLDIIDAMARLANKDIVYVMSGEGKTKELVENRVNELDLGAQVIFLGRIPEEDIPLVYLAADVVSLISRHAPGTSFGLGEGIPLGLVEGLGAGRAILCGDQDGSAEAINRAQNNGIIVNPDCPDEVDAAITFLIENPDQVELMGENSFKYAKEVFEKSEFSHNLLKSTFEINNRHKKKR